MRAILILMILPVLAGCAGGRDGDEESRGLPRAFSRSAAAEQTFPTNYRRDVIEFLRTYLNDPSGLREASISDPEPRTIAGAQRYIACVRYNARNLDGKYGGAAVRMAVFIDGRFDSFEERPKSFCEGAALRPFPELEAMKR